MSESEACDDDQLLLMDGSETESQTTRNPPVHEGNDPNRICSNGKLSDMSSHGVYSACQVNF